MATLPSAARSMVIEMVRRRDAVVAELFDQHAAGLYRLARAILRDPDQAQDVVQDAFLRLIAHVDAGGALPNARGWLYTVAAHGCRDRQRGLRRWLRWTAELDRRQASGSAGDGDGRDGVLNGIRALGRRDRLLVALRSQGLSYREIADVAGIRPASVGRLLARALDRLAERLGR